MELSRGSSRIRIGLTWTATGILMSRIPRSGYSRAQKFLILHLENGSDYRKCPRVGDNKMKRYLLLLLGIILCIASVSALTITSVDAPTLAPGQEGPLSITIKNTLGFDIKEVSISLDFSSLPISSVGSSEDSVDRIDRNDRETFSFTIRAETNAKTGDYNIPYSLTYKNTTSVKRGTIGIRISAQPELSYSASLETPIQGEKTKLSIKIVNKGLGEARFVSFSLSPFGYTLLSEKEVYLGSISSDDFQTAVFDVIFTSQKPSLTGTLSYTDDSNRKVDVPISLPLTVYSRDVAIQKGIISKSKLPMYIGTILVIIIIWIFWRLIAKRRRMQRSLELAGRR